MKLTRELHRAKWSRYKAEEITVIARELLAIEKAEGAVRVSRVLELARDKSHPLHPFVFRLSDRDAAERWRMEEVRDLCRAVEVRYVDDDGETKHAAPLMVSCREVSTDELDDEAESKFLDRAYRSTERALADPVSRKELLAEAAAAADAFATKYARLKEFATVCASMRAVAARVKTRRRRAS